MKFQIETTEKKIAEGENLIRENEGTIYTDNSFEVSGVRGFYRFEDGILIIHITDKPWLASWDMIRDKIKEFFE